MSARPLILFLMGATASGKTDLAMRLADTMAVDLINVDATQVYRGLNIGAAKPEPEVLARYPHALIDIRDPAEPYSAAEFYRDAKLAIEASVAKGRVPLLVGGSMLYFKTLLDGLADLPAADPSLREQLTKEAEAEGWPALHQRLAEVDPVTAERLHPNHSQRILRALEVYMLSGRTLYELHAEQAEDDFLQHYRVVQFAIGFRERATLHQRIEQRYHAMLDQGFEEEVRLLFARGDLSPDLPAIRAAGYRQMWDYLSGALDYDAMLAQGIAATRQLAKRQLTWLRGWDNLNHLIWEADSIAGDGEKMLTQALEFIQAPPL